MSDRLAKLHQRSTLFHPSKFETIIDFPLDEKTLLAVHDQRSRPLKDIKELKAAKKYNLMEQEELLPESSTRFLFKNLYTDSLLTDLFFSQKNINNIQNVIRYLVFRETNEIIDKQSINELLVVMRAIFFEYSAHPPIITINMSEQQKQQLLLEYTKEVDRLNQIVFNSVIPKLISQLQQYLDYLRDASEQPKQMERSKNESIKGKKEYRSVTQVLTGNSL
jgi:hypothetical protein